MIFSAVRSLRLLFRLKGYEPQPITPSTLYRWLNQFEAADRSAVLTLLENVTFFNKERVVRSLLDQNAALHEKLSIEGINPDHIIYVHIDEPGSSNSIMINLLRNRANLQRLDCRFVDASNPAKVLEWIVKLKQVAVVYVDDFLGSGDQFCTARDAMVSSIPTPSVSRIPRDAVHLRGGLQRIEQARRRGLLRAHSQQS